MTSSIHITQAVQIIKSAILKSQEFALRSTNQSQLALYYAIGKYVSQNSRHGFWGEGALEAISQQLSQELPGLRGFSVRNLKNMRTFAENWEVLESYNFTTVVNSADASAELHKSVSDTINSEFNPLELIRSMHISFRQTSADFLDDFFSLSFSHHILIISKTKEMPERLFYIHQTATNKWSCRQLEKQLSLEVFKHQGSLPNNFHQTLPQSKQAFRAIQMFKDSYLLDYINTEELGIRDEEDIDERILEQGIVHNIKKFILSFGHDFAFMGNQYRIEAMGHEHFIDLLFYNRELNCLVAIELKTGTFKTSYLGQLNGYLNLLDDFVKKPQENPSIGIVLCKDVDKTYAEYMIRTYQKPMGVATYHVSSDMPERLRKSLPEIEDLKKLL
ncbi:MAG: DUF1016 family protein [Muribaculaceae bacterium]|nr:DUF1016 family protein [Muribaculaceae bacterium]